MYKPSSFISALTFIFFTNTTLLAEPITYQIAFITDTTGPGAYWGTASKIGTELAAKQLSNSKKSIEILYGEHAGKPKSAVTEVQSIIAQNHPDAIITEFSSATNAAVEIVRQARIPFIGNCGATSFLGRNTEALKSSIEFDTGCQELLRKFGAEGKKKSIVLAGNGEFGDRCLDGAKIYQPEIPTIRFDLNSDLRSEVLKLLHDGYDSVIIAGLEPDAISLLRSLITLKSEISVGFDQTLTASEQITKLINEYRGDVYTFGLKTIPKEFQDSLTKGLNRSNLQASVYAYLTIFQIVEALDACRGQEVVCFRDKMMGSKEKPEYSFKQFDKNRIARWDIGVSRFRADK